MIRVMIDTMIYDKIISDNLQDRISDLRLRGCIKLITTHIQLDQIGDVSDAYYREQLMTVEASCTRTALGVWDVSKWDEWEWGNDATHDLFRFLTINNPDHVSDAIIGATAALKSDIIVTEDRKFANRLRSIAPSVKVLKYEEFKNILESME